MLNSAAQVADVREPTPRSPREMKISELERLSGCNRSTLHHYINMGLLPQPIRRGPKLHLYTHEHLDRVRHIRSQQRAGMTLAQIREQVTGNRSHPSQSPPAEPAAQEEGSAVHALRPAAQPRVTNGPVHDRILDAAAGLFSRQGYESVHMSDIARVASVSKATLYQHFGSKAELFVDCLDRLIDGMLHEQQRYISRESATLRNDVEQIAGSVLASYPMYRMMVTALGEAAFGEDRVLAARAREAFRRMVTIFEPKLRRLMDEGRCRKTDSELLTYMSWGALLGIGARLAHGDGSYSMEQGLRAYLEFVSQGVAPEKE